MVNVMEKEEVWTPEKMEKFLKLCDHLKSYMLKLLDSLDQTDYIKDLKNRLNNTTIWNVIFDISILIVNEYIKQIEKKGDIKHGKE